MKAEILCVGTEILLGDIVNTNAAYIAKELATIGIDCYFQTVVGDNPGRLKNCIDAAFSRADLVVMTGGLGPTCDDLTKETVANYFGLELVEHQESMETLRLHFEKRKIKMTENNKKQAFLPDGATVFRNENGTAPGMAIEKEGKVAVLMPGPPREMKEMMDHKVMPFLRKFATKIIRSHSVRMIGIGESAMADKMGDFMDRQNPTIAPYAKDGECLLRVTAAAQDEAEAERMMEPALQEIQNRLGEYIYGIDVENLEEAVVSLLKEKGLVVATAESCTGGLVAKRLTDISGASDIFECGIISYANRIKQEVLGVSEETLSSVGAVSEACAKEMAEGVRKLSNADIGISTTGIAGPDGGTPQKPVGLVYVGVSTKNGTEVKELHLGYGRKNDRKLIRYMAMLEALRMVYLAARELDAK